MTYKGYTISKGKDVTSTSWAQLPACVKCYSLTPLSKGNPMRTMDKGFDPRTSQAVTSDL